MALSLVLYFLLVIEGEGFRGLRVDEFVTATLHEVRRSPFSPILY